MGKRRARGSARPDFRTGWPRRRRRAGRAGSVAMGKQAPRVRRAPGASGRWVSGRGWGARLGRTDTDETRQTGLRRGPAGIAVRMSTSALGAGMTHADIKPDELRGSSPPPKPTQPAKQEPPGRGPTRHKAQPTRQIEEGPCNQPAIGGSDGQGHATRHDSQQLIFCGPRPRGRLGRSRGLWQNGRVRRA